MSEVDFETPPFSPKPNALNTLKLPWVVRYGEAAAPETILDLVPDIRFSHRESLISELVEREGEGWIPDAPEAKALLCRIIGDEFTFRPFLSPDIFANRD